MEGVLEQFRVDAGYGCFVLQKWGDLEEEETALVNSLVFDASEFSRRIVRVFRDGRQC